MRHADYGDYFISDDKRRLDEDTIVAFLSRSYWADKRSAERTLKSIANSRCYGVFAADRGQIGFARVITDGATMYYLCDVFVDEAWRGKGVGKNLVAFIVEAEEHQGMSGLLATKDAHGLYESYGFVRDSEAYMRRPPQ
ncbi:GNAT family N-acetyltransferase [Cohnella nanjingensis]|uniref:GNAT family N-acetyltransferase n=1 Tax=Cohnella nanjingensis TaxID=1387779 RepID=A0A7X0RQE0_9BACL|nr:GNAT family N-acetyltransferase [Cohnella nanjingensis]MBB6671645.1 GNAT family N-acetyltransferase [Cohnella nanjingensis]